MFSDYKNDVIHTYHQHRLQGRISLNLQDPTPGNLKQECLNVLEVRAGKSDLEILQQWFGIKGSVEGYERAIRNTPAEKFKAFSNFLRGENQDTSPKNIELLSWLIGFTPRPFKFNYGQKNIINKVQIEEGESNVMNTVAGAGVRLRTEDAARPISVKSGGSYTNVQQALSYLEKYKKQGLVAVAVLLVTAYIFSPSNKVKSSINSLFSTPECMYWADDRYIEVECDQVIPNVPIFALDEFKLKHFKRITRWDTLTQNDIGKVYYASVGKKIEFYTTDGSDPREPKRDLRLMSKYIYEKYVKPLDSKPGK